ncbi:MAG: HYR domain-containing protein, partial [Bacteroidales bacterium]|nr:HYR domain-containing protein [Bacteroidales bacterium]
MVNSSIFSRAWEKYLLTILFTFSFLFLITSSATGQESTRNDYTGNWLDNNSWVDGTNPGTAGINVDVEIYGYIIRWGDLDFNQGDLTVNDTLVIYGNLELGNNSGLILGADGLLIVYGDFNSANQVAVASGGTIIVTGTWTMTGSDTQGSFDNDGALYIFNPGDGLKDGPGYTDINCDTCVQDSTDLVNSDVGDFFFGGSFSIETSGPTSFCPGGSVILSTIDTAGNYQWYQDGVVLTGETGFSYTATSTGSYRVEFYLYGQYFLLPAVFVAVDTVAPVIVSCAVDQNLSSGPSCDALVPDLTGSVTVTDNCDVSPLITQSPAAGTSIGAGVTVVIVSVTDASGNTASCTANITVVDDVSPIPDVATLPTVTGECSATIGAAPTATDACAGTITGTTSDALTYNTQGTYTVTWTYDDGNGNIITQEQTVIVDDVTAPVPDVATLADVTAECEVAALTAPTASDNCGGAVTVTNNATLPITAQGTTVVTWTYTDVNGNSSTQNQNVVIDDVTAPVPDVATLPDVTAECEVTSLTAPTATDACAGTIT